MAEKAYRLSENYERRCTGCVQSAVAVVLDALNLENEDIFKEPAAWRTV
ncbi:MAG: hypothetical protein SWK76_15600 [Actinomycetota bacterium]|nr:hypothetical protein [Actinomycetota bacterium]